MNWITISVALTVLVCIAFDNGYATSTKTNVKTTPATAKPVTVAPVVDNNQGEGSGTGNSDGSGDSTTPDDKVTDNAKTGTTDKVAHDGGTNNVNNGTTNTDGNGNGGSGAGDLSAKVLMIATMAGCTLAVYGGL